MGQVDFPGGGENLPPPTGSGGGGGGDPGSFLPASNFDAMCVVPRPGTADTQGTVTDQNNWLRSWTYDTYLWYSEVVYPNPGSYTTPVYFDLMKTDATTSMGQPKDKFHFTYDTAEWLLLSQGGVSAGYGAAFEILVPAPPRRIVVAFVQTGTPADGMLQRGDEILTVDGIDAVNGDSQGNVDAINLGLFPAAVGETHTFVVRDIAGVQRTVTLMSQNVAYDPVPEYDFFPTASGNVGYIVFNDHNAPSEARLVTAIGYLAGVGINDLIIDMRYNGGGYLDIASQLAYMVGNTTLTAGRPFERLEFNDKHPTVDPVTGATIVPTPFIPPRSDSVPRRRVRRCPR